MLNFFTKKPNFLEIHFKITFQTQSSQESDVRRKVSEK